MAAPTSEHTSEDDPEAAPAATTGYDHGTAGARARIAYQPALDGIRGIGLFFVMASHGGFSWARGGFFWVSSFFTLSGYLISSLLIVEHRRHGRIDAKAFWGRRFRRLMPAAIVTLLFVVALVVFLPDFVDALQIRRLRGDGLASLFYVANWEFIRTDTSYAELFSSPSPVQHFWTLSIEEQYYALFPVAIIGALALARGRWDRVAGLIALVTAASISWMLYLVGNGATIDRLYFGTDTRLPELTAGVLLAIVLARREPRVRDDGTPDSNRTLEVAGAAALVVILVLTFTVSRTDEWLYHGGFAVYAGISCLLVAGALQPRGPVRWVLSFRPLRELGILSYSAYLLHWPLFMVLDQDRVGLDGVPLFVVRVSVTVGAALLLNRLVEQPIRTGKSLNGKAALVAVPTAFAAVVVGFVLVTADPPEPETDFAGADQAAATVDDAVPPQVSPTATKVMIVGDSQAWVLGNALDRWSDDHPDDAAVWNVAIAGCGIVRGGEVQNEIRPATCDDWAPRFERELDVFDPDVVVVLSGQWDWMRRKLPEWPDFLGGGDPDFDAHVIAEYTEAATLLGSQGADVVWLTTPCFALEGFGDVDPRVANDTYVTGVADALPELVEVYDLFADVCPGGEFTDELDGIDARGEDGIHLSDDAADWEAEKIMPGLVGSG